MCKGLRVAAGAAWMVALGLLESNPGNAAGLRCSIGEVVIENLAVGSSQSLQQVASLPLALTNTGDQPVTLAIETAIPEPSELRYGALPVPDLSWASVDRSLIELAPEGCARVDVVLHIPDDPALEGKKYQVNVWSHTRARPGELIATGLSTRIIFSLRGKDATAPAGLGGVSVELSPAEVTLRDVSTGRPLSFDTTLDQPLVLRNPSASPVTVELNAVHPQDTPSGLQAGFGDLLSVATFEFTPGRLSLKPGEEVRVSGVVRFQEGKSLPERTGIAILSAKVVGGGVTTVIYSRVYARIDAHAR